MDRTYATQLLVDALKSREQRDAFSFVNYVAAAVGRRKAEAGKVTAPKLPSSLSFRSDAPIGERGTDTWAIADGSIGVGNVVSVNAARGARAAGPSEQGEVGVVVERSGQWVKVRTAGPAKVRLDDIEWSGESDQIWLSEKANGVGSAEVPTGKGVIAIGRRIGPVRNGLVEALVGGSRAKVGDLEVYSLGVGIAPTGDIGDIIAGSPVDNQMLWDASARALVIADSIKIHNTGGTYLDAIDGENDDLNLRAKGSGAIVFNLGAGSDGTKWYDGAAVNVASIDGNGKGWMKVSLALGDGMPAPAVDGKLYCKDIECTGNAAVAMPSAEGHAATKKYVDDGMGGGTADPWFNSLGVGEAASLTAGRLDAAASVYVGANDRLKLWQNAAGDPEIANVGAGQNLILDSVQHIAARLGDDAGAHAFYIQDSADATQWQCDSNGNVIAAGDVKALSFTVGANTLNTTEWAFLDGQDQAVKIASSPQFANLIITAGGDIKPSANLTTAINIAQADGTNFVVFDTTNKRVKLGAATAPLELLHLEGPGKGIRLFSNYYAENENDTVLNIIDFYKHVTDGPSQTIRIYNIATFATHGYTGSDLRFALRPSGGALTDRVVFTHDGKAGFGTMVPTRDFVLQRTSANAILTVATVTSGAPVFELQADAAVKGQFSWSRTDSFVRIYSAADIKADLGDAAGANKFYIRDSALVAQWQCDSDGQVWQAGNLGIRVTPLVSLHVKKADCTANSAYDISHIVAKKTSDMADGFGATLNFRIEDNAAVENTIACLKATRDGADNSGYLVLSVFNAGIGKDFYFDKNRMLTASHFKSDVLVGTQPYACSSVTKNTNLHCDEVDDLHFLTWSHTLTVVEASAGQFTLTGVSGPLAEDIYLLFGVYIDPTGNCTGSPGMVDNSDISYNDVDDTMLVSGASWVAADIVNIVMGYKG